MSTGSRFSNYFGSIGSIGIGKFCPICYPAIVSFLTAVGLGFVVSAIVLKGLLILFLCIGILGLWRSCKIHKNLMPFLTGLLSSAFIYTGKFLLLNNIVFYTGIIGLLVAVVWDMKIKIGGGPCPACREMIGKNIYKKEVSIMARRIEVFTAGCPICKNTLNMVKDVTKACGCEVIERRCSGDVCCDEAVKYGVRTTPTIAVNGVIVFEGMPTKEQARTILARW